MTQQDMVQLWGATLMAVLPLAALAYAVAEMTHDWRRARRIRRQYSSLARRGN